MIEAEWEDLQRTNSPHDIFTCFAHHFQFNFDETYLLCNKVELKVRGRKDKTAKKKVAVTQGFQ